MKKIVCALAAFSALAVALPAAAQPYGDRDGYDRGRGGYDRGYDRGYGGHDLRSDIEQLDNRVDRSYARRAISRREHARLDGMVSQLRWQYRTYMRDGRLSRWERSDLETRINRVTYALRAERRDGDGYRGGHDRPRY